MPFDSDVALLGTGVAPLVVANSLLAQGKTVLLLNTDWDFFLEESELPLDPLLQGALTPERLLNSSPEEALSVLRPDFPGAIEFWSSNSDPSGFHDKAAPHVRQRGRLWISPEKNQNWEMLEDLFVEASDADLKPQILEGLPAARRFPGFSSNQGNFRGLFVPKLCDVDIVRYRNGLLEFVKERTGPERVVCAASQLDLMPEGIRFHSQGSLNTAKIKDGILVFWTPRLTPWIMSQAKKAEVAPVLPKGVRLWEQWSLNSREPADPGIVGMFGDTAVWAEVEGMPTSAENRLAVLRSGPLLPLDELRLPSAGLSWASADSFGTLSHLCHDFLKWDRFSVRAMKPRAIFEWKSRQSWLLSKTDPNIRVVNACDGPLVDVVRVARLACANLLGDKE